MNCINCGSQNNTTSMYCTSNCEVMHLSKNACYCTPNERAFLDEIRETGVYGDYSNEYNDNKSGIDFPDSISGSMLWESDFTKCKLKELVNE